MRHTWMLGLCVAAGARAFAAPAGAAAVTSVDLTDPAGDVIGINGPGNHRTGAIPYAALGARSGQVLRISAREASGNGAAGFFPDVLLALE